MSTSAGNIPFYLPTITGKESKYIANALFQPKQSAGGKYTRQAHEKLEKITRCHTAVLTSSCTHALEMTALLLDIQAGDEVIMASFNFVSAPNAFLLRGATIKFVEIDASSMNISPKAIAEAISTKTKCILVMHYGSVACEMDQIMHWAQKNDIPVVEDAAHCLGAYYKNRHLGTIGDFGTLSFHDTKNVQCGEGGALLINNSKYVNRAKIIMQKGTNREAFVQGLVDKYSWVDIGSSYLMSEISAAFLCAQLSDLREITRRRLDIYNHYRSKIFKKPILCPAPNHIHNGHIFFIKCRDINERNQLINHLKKEGISAYFHYIPLHSSPYGKTLEQVNLPITDRESQRILRLPIYDSMTIEQCDRVIHAINQYYA